MYDLTLEIPGEPVAKGRPRLGKYGVYTPKKTSAAENAIKWATLAQAPKKPPVCPVRVHIFIYKGIPASWSFKRRKQAETGQIQPAVRPDWDNYAKLVCDALNGMFWKDDAQIINCSVVKEYSARPRVSVHIRYYENKGGK